jgi:restriction system protein
MKVCCHLRAESTGLVIGAVGLVVGLTVAVVLCVGNHFGAAALSGLLSFCLTSLVFLLWHAYGRVWLRRTAASLHGLAAARNAQIEQARESLLVAEQCRIQAQRTVALRRDMDSQVEQALGIRTQLAQVEAESDRLKAALGARRYFLLTRQWDNMEGSEFEDFLRQIFELLGYSVRLTRATGDNGVDLIITKHGVRIAVQAKRYGTNVSNGAVQEVHTGMAFYDCHYCAVVTNSQFTKQALELARKINCVLVSGSDLPGLIQGSYQVLESLCCKNLVAG